MPSVCGNGLPSMTPTTTQKATGLLRQTIHCVVHWFHRSQGWQRYLTGPGMVISCTAFGAMHCRPKHPSDSNEDDVPVFLGIAAF